MPEQQSLFVEQAEYIEPEYFEAWTIEHPEEETILRKLSQTGAKLLTGPRGSGKTTLLLKALLRMRTDSGAFPVYVNFKSSLKLEPLYRSSANAVYLFNQWLLLKIYDGIYASLETLGATVEGLVLNRERVQALAARLELGQVVDLPDEYDLNMPALESDVSKVLSALDRRRCVLLLDDAAHAFSPEQQRDFFDFFRQIKSHTISPKAAIYPGVTVYSSTFHVGHDAEQIDIWIKPDSATYIPFLRSLVTRRLPPEISETLLRENDLFQLICFASFGIPRAFLTMISSLQRPDNEQIAISLNRAAALKAIKEVFENTINVFRSLEVKLPLYSAFVRTGDAMFSRAISLVKAYNKTKDVKRKSVSIAIARPVSPEIAKVLAFFQYSGLVMPRGEISRGVKGVFELYALHYAALIDRNALFGQRSINIGEYVSAFENRHPHEFTRTNARTLVDNADTATAFPLALPPCQVCRTPRVNESARFCLNCGAQLKSVSAFESIVSRGIEELPLTARRVERIKATSRLRTIRDILIDTENRELRSVPQIGPYWAKRIYAYAEETIT